MNTQTENQKPNEQSPDREPSLARSASPAQDASEVRTPPLQSTRCGPGRPALRWLVPVALVVVVSSLFITRTVVAKISINTIDTVGIVADKGRQVTVTGPAAVTESERTEMRVTVTQRSTGAVAQGVIFFTGTGQTNQWEITAVAEGRAAFEAGPATVVGLARSSVNGQTTDAHQWLVDVTLFRE